MKTGDRVKSITSFAAYGIYYPICSCTIVVIGTTNIIRLPDGVTLPLFTEDLNKYFILEGPNEPDEEVL